MSNLKTHSNLSSQLLKLHLHLSHLRIRTMFLMTSWSDCNLQVIYTSFYLIADYKITKR